jgi:hypothetical protein
MAEPKKVKNKDNTHRPVSNNNAGVTNMSRRPGTTFASVANHLASMAKTICNQLTSSVQLPEFDTETTTHTAVRPNQEPHSLIGDWLIDSGCTVHITPYLHDFVGTMEPYSITLFSKLSTGASENSRRREKSRYSSTIHSTIPAKQWCI